MAKKNPSTVTLAPEKPVRLKKDGTPWPAATERRSNEEMLAHYERKLLIARGRHDKEIKGIEKKIAYFKNGPVSRTVDPAKAEAALKGLLEQGMTPEQILLFSEQARLAVAGLKGKSEEEIKAILTPPPFLAVTAPV